MTPPPVLVTWKLEEYGQSVFLVCITGNRSLRSDVAIIRQSGQFMRCGNPRITEIVEPQEGQHVPIITF